MARAPLAERLWFEAIMPVFLERFLLVVCTAAFYGVVISNSMQIDGHYRASIGIVLVGIAYILGHTVHRTNQAAQQASTTAAQVPFPAPKLEPKTSAPPPDSSEPARSSKAAPGAHPALTGSLEFPGFRENVKNVSLSIGGFHANVPLEGLRNKTFTGAAFSINGQVITPYLEGNHIYVDVSVYGGPGVPAVQVKKGAVTVDMPGWDRNSNESAFEVVNERGVPVFQMVYLTPTDISIRGTLVFGGGFLIVANETTSLTNPRDPFAFAPKPLFKYPSRLHRGESAE